MVGLIPKPDAASNYEENIGIGEKNQFCWLRTNIRTEKQAKFCWFQWIPKQARRTHYSL